MDRRRFHPSGETLEGRQLLSSILGGSNYSTSNANYRISVADLPETFAAKQTRIDHLPFFLHQINNQRYLPIETVHRIQADMNALVDNLHGSNNSVVSQFDLGLRHIYPYKTLDANSAKIISHAFGSVLAYAGATPQQTATFQNDMNALALADSRSIDPAQLAANDYALVLQDTLAVGRPITVPSAPSLAAKDGVRVDHGRGAITRVHLPTFVGQYTSGATKTESINMVLLDGQGEVLGSGPVTSTGAWTATVRTPLPDGHYTINVRSLDTNGFVSGPSHSLNLKVVTPHTPGSGK